VTRFYIAGIPERVIAEIVGWSEEQISKIIRRYVGRAAATKALIRRITNENISCKIACKTVW
jgi:rRNA processing protein Krr1/Pno1